MGDESLHVRVRVCRMKNLVEAIDTQSFAVFFFSTFFRTSFDDQHEKVVFRLDDFPRDAGHTTPPGLEGKEGGK